MCKCNNPMSKIPQDKDPNPSNFATVYDYRTGNPIDTVDLKTYKRYLEEIEDCDIGAVFGDDYGYEAIIFMQAN